MAIFNNIKQIFLKKVSSFFDFFTQVVARIANKQANSAKLSEIAPRLTEENKENKNGKNTAGQILTRQMLLFGGGALVVIVVGFAFLNIGSNGNSGMGSGNDKNKEKSKKINVEVASEALDPDRMWRNHFEDKLHETQETTNTQLAKISDAIHAKSEETISQTKGEIEELKKQLHFAKEALEEATNEMKEARLKSQESDKEFDSIVEANLQSALIEDEMNITTPRDSKLYIPETGYVTGTLLGGISVSTSVGSSSEPVPVVIRLTGKGNLPKNFKADLSTCRILGSSYGDLSSERAVIRAETMVCEDKSSEEIVTTKIAGLVYGDDGMNGIKGRVVDMSTKHIKNAAIGGMLSGFAGTMKNEGQFTLSSLGAVNTTNPGIGSRLKDNTFTGMGNAAEKIADYYIKQAENMSPVLLIPGGTRVDIVFTKGVYLGSTDIVQTIEKERKNHANEPK